MRLITALRYLPLLHLANHASADDEDNWDPYYEAASNYRPRNVTGLDYWYYPWKGSYYNGTVMFAISDVVLRDPDDDEDVELCASLQNITYSLSYPGILAVTQTEGEDVRPENTNPIDVMLSTSYSNFTAYFNDFMDSGNMQTLDMPWVFQSIRFSRYAYPEETKPEFNLTVSDSSTTSFRVTGSSELETNPLESLQFNMSSCNTFESWWGASFASDASDTDGLGVMDPALDLTFDDAAASFRIDSWIYANNFREDDDVTPAIAARISIEFLGRIDAARSDVLNAGTPVTWTPTVGFGNNSANLDYVSDGSTSAASALRVGQVGISGLFWGILGAVVGFGFL